MTENGYGPAGQDYVLASGRKVRFEQPDLYAIAEGQADLPNEVAAEIFNLIFRGRRTVDLAQLYTADTKHMRTLYRAAQQVIVPRLKLEDDDEDGVIGRREVSVPDLGAAYNFLVLFAAPPSPPAQPESDSVAPAQSTPTE